MLKVLTLNYLKITSPGYIWIQILTETFQHGLKRMVWIENSAVHFFFSFKFCFQSKVTLKKPAFSIMLLKAFIQMLKTRLKMQ